MLSDLQQVIQIVGSNTEKVFSRLDHVQLAIPRGGETGLENSTLKFLDSRKSQPEELAKRGGAWFRSGDVTLHVGVDERFTPATKAHPAFRCVDYPALLDRLSRSN